jgi:hypothetical protein
MFAMEALFFEAAGMTVAGGGALVVARNATLREVADIGQSAGRAGAVAELTVDGQRFVGISGGGAVENMNGQLVGIAMGNSSRNDFCFECAGIQAINAALNAGANLRGSVMRVLQMGETLSNRVHGSPKPPCSICDEVLDILGVELR